MTTRPKEINIFLQSATFESFSNNRTNWYTLMIIRWTNITILVFDKGNNYTLTKGVWYITMFENQIKQLNEVYHDWRMSISDGNRALRTWDRDFGTF